MARQMRPDAPAHPSGAGADDLADTLARHAALGIGAEAGPQPERRIVSMELL